MRACRAVSRGRLQMCMKGRGARPEIGQSARGPHGTASAYSRARAECDCPPGPSARALFFVRARAPVGPACRRTDALTSLLRCTDEGDRGRRAGDVPARVEPAALATCGPRRGFEAAGEPAPTLRAQVYSPYEQAAIDAALADRHEVEDPAPEGKTLEGIDIVTLDVIEPRDPAPTIINALHVDDEALRHRSRDPPAPRRALQDGRRRGVGAEPARPSAALARPRRPHRAGATPNRVRLLVITKDVWSLRLAWDLQRSRSGIEDLVLQPSETNFLGTHQVAALYFELDPATLSFGAGYHVPRLDGTRNVLDASARRHLQPRPRATLEGSNGALLAYQPLFSREDEVGVGLGGDVGRADHAPLRERGGVLLPGDEPLRGRERHPVGVPRADVLRAGVDHPLVRVGREARLLARRLRRPPRLPHDGSASRRRSRGARAVRGAELPRSDNRVGPFVQYHGYQTRFIRVLDFQTLGLQEDYRLGHEVYLRVYPMPKALGSSRDLLGVYAAMNYTVALGDGLVRGTVESVTEAQPEPLEPGLDCRRRRDRHAAVGAREVRLRRGGAESVPQLPQPGELPRRRLAPARVSVELLRREDVVVSNLEFRTTPVELLHAVEVGADLFYDVGDAAFGFSNLHPKQGVGARASRALPAARSRRLPRRLRVPGRGRGAPPGRRAVDVLHRVPAGIHAPGAHGGGAAERGARRTAIAY